MQIIPLLYWMVLPLLWLLGCINATFKKYTINALSTFNLLVWMYAVYSIKILMDIAQFVYSLNGSESDSQFMQWVNTEFLLKQCLKVLLPFFFLAPLFRKSLLFSLLVLGSFCWSMDWSLPDWSTLFFTIPYCFSLFSATYALLWLLKEHPSQKVAYMYNPFQLAVKYIRYYVTAMNGKGHGVHSPFVFDLVVKVLNDQQNHHAYQSIEQIRQNLLSNHQPITIEDFGAGSRVKKSPVRKIATIANSSLKPKKFSQLLFRLVNYFQPATIVELGTSLGITSAYLAAANNSAKVITMEGSTAVAEIAQSNFNRLNLHNIKLVTGNFDYTLSQTLKDINNIDFAFIDGNHRYEPTVRYFKQILSKSNQHTLIILDDIHWSEEMEGAWEEVKQHPAVTLTIDLFFIGLVFLRKEQQQKEHFVIRF